MTNLFRLLFAIFLIVLIAPQTPKENIVLTALHAKGIFANYGEEIRFLKRFSWFCILIFLVIAFVTSVK